MIGHGPRDLVVEAPLAGRHLHARVLDALDAGLDGAPHPVDTAGVDGDAPAGVAGDLHDLAELRDGELSREGIRALGHVAARAHDLDGVRALFEELRRETRDRVHATGDASEEVAMSPG